MPTPLPETNPQRRHEWPQDGFVDLVMNDLLDLPEIGGDIEIEGLRKLRHLGFGGAHLQLSVVLLDLLADFAELPGGVLNLLEIVAVGFFMRRELLLVRGQFPLRLLQLERELGGGIALAGLQVRFGLGLELLNVIPAHLHLARDTLDQGTVGFKLLPAFFKPFDSRVVFVLHLCDRVGFPKYVGDLVQLEVRNAFQNLPRINCRPPFLLTSSFNTTRITCSSTTNYNRRV